MITVTNLVGLKFHFYSIYNMKYLSFRADSGGETWSHYLQALAAFLRENYLEFPLDRIYLMVKQYMVEIEEVSTLHWSLDNEWTCYTQGAPMVCHRYQWCFSNYCRFSTPDLQISQITTVYCIQRLLIKRNLKKWSVYVCRRENHLVLKPMGRLTWSPK